MNMRKAVIAVICGALAWYGHNHGWGFWVFVLVFASGYAFGVSNEVLEEADRQLQAHPGALEILERDRRRTQF